MAKTEKNSITIEDVRKLADEAREGWRDIYEEAERDLEFYDGKNQWVERDYNARIRAGRHAITINRLPQFVHQVENEIRQNTPTIKVLPADSNADIETAEILQDLIRNIEYVSQADVAYDTSASMAIKCSIGFMRIDHDYVSPDTFEQHILIKRVPNPLSVVIDPSSIEADGSDARYGFVFEEILISKFKSLYPKAKAESFDEAFISKFAPSFTTQEGFMILADLYKIKEVEENIFLLQNGETVSEADYEKMSLKVPVVNERVITKNQCIRYKVTGAEILEESEFPSSYIPLVPTYGEEHWIKGKRHLYSLIRNAKDVQKMYNYAKSLETELIQQAPKAPYIAAEGQLSGYEDMWRNPEQSNVLIYKSADVNGTMVPPPQRVAPPPVPPGVIQLSLGASLGNKSNEQSGKAIIARQRESDVSTYHFADNLSRSIACCGRIILDMIPRIYDTPRILRVLGEDGEPRNVAIGMEGQAPKIIEGIDRIYDINVGKYDAVVVTGPSFATKRVEGAEAMLQLSQGAPQVMQGAADLLVDNLDIPNKEPLKKRLKAIIALQMPGVVEEEENEVPDLRPQLQQAEMMMNQAAQQIEQLQMQIAQLEQEKLNDAQKAELERQKNLLQEQENVLRSRELDIQAYEVQVKEKEIASTHEKHFKDKDAEVTLASINKGSYVPENLLRATSETDAAIMGIGELVAQLSGELANTQQVVGAIAEQMSKPKKVVARRVNGELTAEVVQ
jgi:hypothetical protein